MSGTLTTQGFTFSPIDGASPPFSFSFQANGINYSATVTWNLARQDWYIQIYDQGLNLLINHPLISSPLTAPQNLAPGIFTNVIISYNDGNSIINVTTS
jgi:hypothetical protein